MAKSESVAVEFDSPTNSNFLITPLQQVVRGKFDLHRVREPLAGKLHSQWPEPIPGQRLEFDFETGEGAIVDPLHEERFKALRAKIEAMGQSLPEARQPFKLDAATFSHWIGNLIQSGDAIIVAGAMPGAVAGTPQLRFNTTSQPDPIDKLTAAIERQADGQAKMLELLAAVLGKLTKN